MIRVESDTGWWLITHRDHAQLAAAFAAHWGNEQFLAPQPRARVLYGIGAHDDGWIARDARPSITRQGKPSAFSVELVGKYSAFEEIDLADYLAVRARALTRIEEQDSYAALLVSMHTYNLLTARADRSTIPPEQLPLLDNFLSSQLARQQSLRTKIAAEPDSQEIVDETISNNFKLLQANDNLSLYGCVGYGESGNLLHPLPTSDGKAEMIEVFTVSSRYFRLEPYPFDEPLLTLTVPARHVHGKVFATSAELSQAYFHAPEQQLTVTVSA